MAEQMHWRVLAFLLAYFIVVSEAGLSGGTLQDAKDFIHLANQTYDSLKISHLIVVATFLIVTILSLIALSLAWYVTITIYFKCEQNLNICNDKIIISDYWLSRRAFSPHMIDKLSRVANFDVSKNSDEIQEMLKSIYAGKTVAK